ncbi:MAG: aminotransferase class III-fold pyridoxal phosphate-dependent enzyme, partial [Chloroflexi bacterium]|nr:aminotransferase class III-fold pyridoxal phosphate-dependent enzyme [Chloroflexota bacterium]
MATHSENQVKELQESALEHLWVYLREPSDMAEKGEPQIFVEGKGVHVTDALGNTYIDAMSGLWLKNVGYGQTEIADAAYQQMLKLTYMPLGTTTEPAVRLAEKVASITPGDLSRCFFTSGGSEANETAMKLSRAYFKRVGEPTRYKFISRKGSYHGATFGTLALGGTRVSPTMILEIKDRDGFSRFDYRDFRTKPRLYKRNALPEDAVYVLVNMMEGVCTADPGRDYYPSGRRTERLGRPRAGKTGTSNLSKDAWFCGFTPQYTCIVWFGYEDSTSLGNGIAYTGGALASPVWTDVMIVAHEGLPVEEFHVPPGVEFYGVDRLNGLAGDDWQAAFIRGTKPPTEIPSLLDLQVES